MHLVYFIAVDNGMSSPILVILLWLEAEVWAWVVGKKLAGDSNRFPSPALGNLVRIKVLEKSHANSCPRLSQ